jgi:peptide-methionine (S)-S-oxide reductase
MLFGAKTTLVSKDDALKGRDQAMPVPPRHLVLGVSMTPPYPQECEVAEFALGCFWGAERVFWQLDGVFVTAVGYSGGYTPNPTYEEVCSGRTAHAEVVRVVFDPKRISYEQLVKTFFESHDPTQGMRQGNDIGTQYRSAIYTQNPAQQTIATSLRDLYQAAMTKAGYAEITTEICAAGPFYFAEDYHQQYLAANPNGYCGLGGTGVGCPVGVAL